MKFFADEGLDYPLVKLLREADYDVLYAAEDYIGAPDAILLKTALLNNRILLTKDKDFGELAIRFGEPTSGVVLIRIDQLNRLENTLVVLGAIKKYEAELQGSLTVIQEDKIRIRTLK